MGQRINHEKLQHRGKRGRSVKDEADRMANDRAAKWIAGAEEWNRRSQAEDDAINDLRRREIEAREKNRGKRKKILPRPKYA